MKKSNIKKPAQFIRKHNRGNNRTGISNVDKELYKQLEANAPILDQEQIPEVNNPFKHVEVGDMFDPYTKEQLNATGTRAMYELDAEMLKYEWVVKFPTMEPRVWMRDIKGLSHAQAKRLFEVGGKEGGWNEAKVHVLDRMTQSVVKRHIDQMAEVQEMHIKASKIGLAKAVEMLTKLQIEPAKDKSGKIIRDGDNKVVYRGFRSIDLLNSLSAVEKAQQIYRRAMGLPNEEAGLAQILDKVNLHFNQTNIQNNVQMTPAAPDPVQAKMRKLAEDLNYDQILEFVEFRREQKKLLKERMIDMEAESKH